MPNLYSRDDDEDMPPWNEFEGNPNKRDEVHVHYYRRDSYYNMTCNCGASKRVDKPWISGFRDSH